MLAGSCRRSKIGKYHNGMSNKGGQKSLQYWGSGTQYVAMVTSLLGPYCGAHLVGSYCKEANLSDSNWLRYLSFNINFIEFMMSSLG